MKVIYFCLTFPSLSSSCPPPTSPTCLQFFRSVQSTCTELLKVIERYQQRITRESLRASLPQSSRTS